MQLGKDGKMSWSFKTYIKNASERIKKLFEMCLKLYESPMILCIVCVVFSSNPLLMEQEESYSCCFCVPSWSFSSHFCGSFVPSIVLSFYFLYCSCFFFSFRIAFNSSCLHCVLLSSVSRAATAVVPCLPLPPHPHCHEK